MAKNAKVGAKDVAEEPPPIPETPAGGLDMPAPRPALEVENFPGESQLTEEERSRWLILHFAIPRTLMTWDVGEKRTTQDELNDVMSTMAWGSILPATSEWLLESEDPTLEPPHSALISYAEFVERTFPVDQNMGEQEREENVRMASQKRATFTDPGEPGVKFRPMFDQMVKCLAHTNKALVKAFDIKRVILNEDEEPEDNGKDEAPNIMRFGRHQILPSFWNLLINLTKQRRRFSIVFRSFGPELDHVQRELRLFCQLQHPAYSGQNKTQKPPPMNGDKNSKDMRLRDEHVGKVDRISGRLEFLKRPLEGLKVQPVEGEELPTEFKPTVYEFPPFHSFYAGLMHHILDECNTAAIMDDRTYWASKGKVATAGKPLPVDHGGGLAETKVQHIFFDGHIKAGDAHCVDVRDVVSGEPLPLDVVDGMFAHRVDFFKAVVDPEYYIKALDACELTMSQRILETRKVLGDNLDEDESPDELRDLPAKEYLYRTIIPALLPALEAVQRDRPADPIEFLAFYMLRHPKQYSKTLKA